MAERLRAVEFVQLPSRSRFLGGKKSGEPFRKLSARNAVVRCWNGQSETYGGVVRDGSLRIPIAPVAVQEAAFWLQQWDLFGRRRLSSLSDGFVIFPLRLQPACVSDGERKVIVAQDRGRQIDENRVLIADANPEKPAKSIADN